MFREGLGGRPADERIGVGKRRADEITAGRIPAGHRRQRFDDAHADYRRGILHRPRERVAAEPAQPCEPPDGERSAVGGMAGMAGMTNNRGIQGRGGGEHGLEQRGDLVRAAAHCGDSRTSGPRDERVERQPPHGHVGIAQERHEPVVAEAGEVGGR